MSMCWGKRSEWDDQSQAKHGAASHLDAAKPRRTML